MATEVERLVVRIMGDNRSYLRSITSSVRAARSFKEALEAGRRITRSVETATESYAKTIKNLNLAKRLGVISNKTWVRGLKKAREELALAERGTKKTAISTNILGKELRAVAGTPFGSFISKVVKSITSLFGLRDMLKSVVKRVTQLGVKLRSLGSRLTMFITLPVIAMATKVVKSFASFDLAMTESQSIMKGLSASAKKDMRAMALDLARNSKFGPAKLAKAYFFLASAGLNARQSIAALPAVTNFATAGAFSLERATKLAAGAQNALGLESRNAQTHLANMRRVMDVLVTGNQIAQANVEEFSEALTNRAAPAMVNYGIRLEEGVAVLAAYANRMLSPIKPVRSLIEVLGYWQTQQSKTQMPGRI